MTSQLDDMLLLEAAKFTDWHVDINKPESSVVFASQSDGGADLAEAKPMRVPERLLPVLGNIIGTLRDHRDGGDQPAFAFDLCDMRFRGQRIRPGRYALRRSRSKVDPLKSLGLGTGCEQVLLDPEFRSGGLLLVCGEHGAGKSTTVRSAIVERLKMYGGYCQTVEAPIEVDFEGFHGDGYIEQVDATNTGYAYEVETAMRKFPAATRSMFYFGEVLGEDAAAELARLVPRGNLVLTTIHAKSPEDGIRMLVALAERGGETYARELIASGLKAVVHQKIQKGRPVVQYFKVNEQMRNVIADSKVPLSQLRTAIDQQSRAAAATALRSTAAAQPRMTF